MSAFKDTVKSTLGQAGKKVLAGLNRADEIGGEVRDAIQERIRGSARAQRVLERVRALRGGKPAPVAEHRAEPAEPVDAPPTAAEIAAEEAARGLGDPGIAAQVYGRKSCPWTGRAITVLETKKIDFDFIDLDLDSPDSARFESLLIAETKQNTVPYIYLRGQFIGGFNALSEYARLGQLDYLILSEADRQSADPALRKVVVVPRPDE